jgi:type IV pilus assembly protein PilW
MNVLRNRKGFTLIELLVAMVLSVILMAAIYSTYYSQQKSYLVQEQVSAMQQNLRAAMFYMEREIRIAGCDPTKKLDLGIITANVNSLSFSEDADGNEAPTTITYSLYTGADGIQKLGRDTGGGDVAVADYIDVLNFVYLDKDGTMLDDGGGSVTVPANIAKIRSIQVTVIARAGREDHTYTDTNNYFNQHDLVNPILAGPNDHYRRMLLSTNIKCRNLWL